VFYRSDSRNPKPSLNLLSYFSKDAVLSLAQTSITRAVSPSGVAGTGKVDDGEDKIVRFFERLGTTYPTTRRHNVAALFWEPLILHDIRIVLKNRQKKQSKPNSGQRDKMVGIFNILHTEQVKERDNFLTSWEPDSFSRRILLHGVSK
jgi:hypothetical protein